MLLRVVLASAALAAGRLLESKSISEIDFLRGSGIVQELLKDDTMSMKLQVLGAAWKSTNSESGAVSLLQTVPESRPASHPMNKDATSKSGTGADDVIKELTPVLNRMQSSDPKGAHMLQSIIQMVGSLATNKKNQEKNKGMKDTQTKKAFLQVKNNKNIKESTLKDVHFHFDDQHHDQRNSTNSENSADPAVMEERLMRIQPILLRLKQMNSRLFGGLANVADKAERHAENEVVNGSL